MSLNTKIYFPGLNGLRFFAALAVIITHVELLKGHFGYASCWEHPVVFMLGSLGVFFFFVLSGFLITFLLLKERQLTNTISIKQFYIRRILRIWPLYYFILAMGFFILPHIKFIEIGYLSNDFSNYYWQNLFLYLIIFPNIAFSLYSAVPHIGQSWSIGVEEQFYLFWPLIIKKSKNIIKAMVWIIVILILIKLMVLFLPQQLKQTNWYVPLKKFLAMTKLESMAVGGIGAYLLFIKSRYIKVITNRFAFIVSIIAILPIIYYTPEIIQDGIHLVYSIIFLVIIINVISISENKNILEKSVFRYLGKISYGLYMYHLMIIPFVLYVFKANNIVENNIIGTTIIYIVILLITIGVSSLSYYIFEEKLINLKQKYSKIYSKA